MIEDLSHLAKPGEVLSLRVTPKAARETVRVQQGGGIRVTVTVVPEKGKANAAVIGLMSRALKVPKSRLEIVKGAQGRDKKLKIL